MDADLAAAARHAVRCLDAVLAEGSDLSHERVRLAVEAVAEVRGLAILKARQGTVPPSCRDRANALLSLAYGAEFPLSGLHLRRFRETRDGMTALAAGSDDP